MATSVVVLGASADRSKFGNKAVRAFALRGWRVIPVNPRGGAIEGQVVIEDITKVSGPVDAVSVYLPPERTLPLLPAIAALSPKTVWLNPGAESAALLEAARKLSLPVHVACSIVAIGLSPYDLPE